MWISILLALQIYPLISSRASPQTSPHPHHHLPIYSVCNQENTLALTFDDGPGELSEEVDRALKQSGARASFFVNGNNAGCIYDYADELLSRFQAGHLIGNHGWSHEHMKKLDREQMNDQLERVEEAMVKILGVKPLYFRPPYGEYNAELLLVAKERGYRAVILWSQDSEDSLDVPPSADKIVSQYRQYEPNQIVLNHEISVQTVQQVMPQVLPEIQTRGLTMMTVAECMGKGSTFNDWYHVVGQPGSRDSSWTCDGTPHPGSS